MLSPWPAAPTFSGESSPCAATRRCLPNRWSTWQNATFCAKACLSPATCWALLLALAKLRDPRTSFACTQSLPKKLPLLRPLSNQLLPHAARNLRTRLHENVKLAWLADLLRSWGERLSRLRKAHKREPCRGRTGFQRRISIKLRGALGPRSLFEVYCAATRSIAGYARFGFSNVSGDSLHRHLRALAWRRAGGSRHAARTQDCSRNLRVQSRLPFPRLTESAIRAAALLEV